MTISLAPNITPAGTRPGSQIKVVDAQTVNGATEFTAGLPISPLAQGGDVVFAQWAIALSTTTYSAGLTTTPGGLFTGLAGNLATNGGPPASMVIYGPLYRVCAGTPGKASPDADRVVGLSWNSSLNQLSWALIVWTLRFVDSTTVFDVTGSYATSGTTPSSNGVTGQIATATDGCLAIGAMAAYGGPTGVGLAISPLPQWYNREDAVNGIQPNLGLTAGIVDLPVASTWLGITACAFQSGQPLANVSADWVGSVVAFRPTPAPGAPTLTLAPSGSSIDAAGLGGTPLKATMAYTPVRGQGQLDAWFFGRAPHAGGATQWWNADANLWQTAEYANLDTPVVDPVTGLNTFTYVFPASAWADDATNWDTAAFVREGARGKKSSSSAVQTFTADPAPVVKSVSITNPNSATPTIGWTESITRPASAQTQYRTKLFTLATTQLSTFDPNTSTAIYDSGAQTSAALSAATSALAGGQDLVPYVVIAQTGGQVSAWKAGPTFFNNQGAALAVPAIGATAGVDGQGAPQVALALTGTAATAKVEYSDDGGATWATVRDAATGTLATALALAGGPTIYDGEATPGVSRSYRATGYSAAGAYPRSAPSASVTATPALGQFWLRRPLTGDSMLIRVTGDKIIEQLREDATEHRIGGRANTVWVREAPVHGGLLKFTIRFMDQASSDKFDAWRGAQETLLLQTDVGRQYYVALPPEPARELFLSGSRLAGKPRRELPLECAVADRP